MKIKKRSNMILYTTVAYGKITINTDDTECVVRSIMQWLLRYGILKILRQRNKSRGVVGVIWDRGGIIPSESS